MASEWRKALDKGKRKPKAKSKAEAPIHIRDQSRIRKPKAKE